MGLNFETYLDRWAYRRSARTWERAAREAESLRPEELRELRKRARQMRRHLDQLIHAAEARLDRPVDGLVHKGLHPGTDWVWRPDIWSGPIATPGHAAFPSPTVICSGATVFHDCRWSELALRQLRNTRAKDRSPYGLRLDILRFSGSFVSVVLDLPPEAAQGLRRKHLIRVDLVAEIEWPVAIYARLNVRHGPNLEQLNREVVVSGEELLVEFDLAYSKVNEKRVEKMWIDLIFNNPAMNQIILRDVVISRSPRAEL